MNALAATGSSTVFNTENYQTVNLTLSGAGTPTGTVKFFISDQELAPDATAAASPTNQWAYVGAVDLQSGTVIAGNTGVAFAGSNATNMYAVNSNGMRWTGAVVTAYTAGNYTVLLRAHAAMAPAV